MTTTPDRGLERFLDAQDEDRCFYRALEELRSGRKRTHWMWFVFPQLAGLGQSATSRHFAIGSLDEARAYLAHPVLGVRLLECANAVVGLEGVSAVDIFGSLDAQKLRSSMALFLRADPAQGVFQRVLDRYFDGRPDPATDALL